MTLKVTVTTTRSEHLYDNKYAQVFIPERIITTRFYILQESAEELMPRTETAYVLRLGHIPLKQDQVHNVRVKLEVEASDGTPHAGLVFSSGFRAD